jgi:hypothetical protein
MITTWDTHCCIRFSLCIFLLPFFISILSVSLTDLFYVYFIYKCWWKYSHISWFAIPDSFAVCGSERANERASVWSALMLVGFMMSNKRDLCMYEWMNEWMNRMEMYKKKFICAESSLPHVVFRLCFTLNYGIICMMNFSLSLFSLFNNISMLILKNCDAMFLKRMMNITCGRQ